MTDENIIIIHRDMPARIKSFVIPDGFGNYTIVVNSCLTREQNQISVLHEIEHIEHGDYDTIRNVDVLEAYRHNIQYKSNNQYGGKI